MRSAQWPPCGFPAESHRRTTLKRRCRAADRSHMSETGLSATPAGWYPDPWIPNTERWWNRMEWTQQVRPRVIQPNQTWIGWHPVAGGQQMAYWDGSNWTAMAPLPRTSNSVANGVAVGLILIVIVGFLGLLLFGVISAMIAQEQSDDALEQYVNGLDRAGVMLCPR